MKPVIINGSPRNKKSNSTILIEKFIEGYMNIQDEEPQLFYLAEKRQQELTVDAYSESDTVIFIFPLYTDCMPGIVKEFIEKIALKEPVNNKRLGYIVQSGFPEAKQSEYLERYLRKLTIKRLGAEYLGTVIKGGVEGIQIMPESMTKKLFQLFYNLGVHFAQTGQFAPEIKEKLGKPYIMSPSRRALFRLFKLTGLTNFYWNSRLKENNAFQKRFDRPYLSA